MKPPKTHKQEILRRLIKKGKVSIKRFYWMSGFRTRISELGLKHGLILNSKTTVKRFSKYGNSSIFTVHQLPPEQKARAIKLYNELQN